VPLPGFGHALVSGTIEDVNKYGLSGIFSGALKATAVGITAAVVFGFLAAVTFNPRG
jgi:stage V sporulation protein AE